MPLATELLPLLKAKLDLSDEMADWLGGVSEQLEWLRRHEYEPRSKWPRFLRHFSRRFAGSKREPEPFTLNIEEVFHRAYFDIEVHRLRQHLSPVGRMDGPGTPWDNAEAIGNWVSNLGQALIDVILERDEASDLTTIARWADVTNPNDAVITFNYDTLAERALANAGRTWNHGTQSNTNNGIPVYKLHGSIDWIVAHRSERFSQCDILFDKMNENRSDGNTGHVEEDCRLWRCNTSQQLKTWVEDRDLQLVPQGASPRTVGIAGLGAYKELHQIPGLGCVWTRAMRALYDADLAVVVGFSMSDFDTMAQMQFAHVARARARENRDLHIKVIDPFINQAAKDRFRRVFSSVAFIQNRHETFDWSRAN
jgi:hypothetical protein